MSEQRQNERYIEAAFLCDHAENYGNRMSILGAFVNMIGVGALPVVHRLTLVLRIAWAGTEVQAEVFDLSIEVLRPDGETCSSASTRLQLESAVSEHPELPSAVGFTVPVLLPMEMEGLYRVTVRLGGQVEQVVPLKVVVAPQAG